MNSGMGMGGGGMGGMGMGGGGMGMNQGMGGMGNMANYGYRNHNWGNYQMNNSYNIPAAWIESNAQMVFMNFDRNGSGFLDM